MVSKEERLQLIENFKERYKTISNKDLEFEMFFGGHHYGSGRKDEDEEDNNYYGIQYDCACLELKRRGLYKFSEFYTKQDVLSHLTGDYDYHKAIIN
jgi:hypothetical protein